MSSPYRRLSDLSKKAVTKYFPLADVCDFSTSPPISASSPSVAISLAVAPGLFQDGTPPVIRLQHLDLLFKPFFVPQITLVPPPEQNEATEERVVRYVIILRVLVVFVRQGLYAFDQFHQIPLVRRLLPPLLSFDMRSQVVRTFPKHQDVCRAQVDPQFLHPRRPRPVFRL